MKFRFWMSHPGKNSVRDKVIGKKRIYLERNTLHGQSVGPSQRVRGAPRYGVGSFYWGGKFHRRLLQLLWGRSVGISMNWDLVTF